MRRQLANGRRLTLRERHEFAGDRDDRLVFMPYIDPAFPYRDVQGIGLDTDGEPRADVRDDAISVSMTSHVSR